MKKRCYVACMALLVAALVVMPTAAQSAVWVGAELGGNFPGSTTVKAAGIDVSDVSFQPSVIGGATIGYDFVNSGFGAYSWPDWMKYFSFAMDFTFNRLNIASVDKFGLPNSSKIDGYCAALTFLFMAHYGLFPDSQVPAGRVHPYIGVGPALVWSALEFHSLGLRRGSATNVALVVEPGIRWMALPNVSIDTSFRWRYAVPSYEPGFNGPPGTVNIKVDPLNQFSFLVRASYHF